MADLITTIKVNSSQFDNSIKESTNQIRKFKSEGDKAGRGVSDFGSKLGGVALDGVAKLAGALGVAFTAMEAFDKMIQSTQGTADAFEIKMQQARAGVDYFFTSLSTGNWDNFFTGILKATEYAKEFAKYMDQLGDIKVSTQFFSGSEQRLMSEQRAILSDPDATIKEKESALNMMESINKRVEERAKAQSDTSKGAISERISEELNKVNSRAYDAFRNLSEKEVQEIYDIFEEVNKLDISGGQKYYKFKEGLDKKGLVLEDGLSMSIFKSVANQLSGGKTPGSKVSKNKERLENEFKDRLVKDIVDNLEDWELPLYGIEDRNDYDPALVLTSTFFEKALSGTDKKFMDYEEKLVGLNEEIDGLRKLQKQSKKITDKESNPWPKSSSFTTEDLETLNKLEKERANLIMSDPVSNALVELKNVVVDSTNKELAQLNQDSENELTKVANNQRIINRERKKLYSEGKKLYSEGKNRTNEILPEGSIAEIEKRISQLNKQIKLETDPTTYKQLYDEIERLKNEVVYIQVMYKTTAGSDPVSLDIDTGLNTPTAGGTAKSFEQVGNIVKNIANKNLEDYKQNLIDTATQSEQTAYLMQNAFGGVANMMGALGNISEGSTSQILGGFQSVLSGIGTMIPAIHSLTSAKQGEAIAGAVASGSSQPFPLNLIAITSGVAAVMAGFAQMTKVPKFAKGGLVYGNTIAQVGEYPGVSNNPEVIAPLSKLRKILADTNGGGNGSVDFRIAGKDLVGVINNYSSKNNKK